MAKAKAAPSAPRINAPEGIQPTPPEGFRPPADAGDGPVPGVTTYWVPIGWLLAAPYNDPLRTECESIYIRSLTKSLGSVGQISPIIVTPAGRKRYRVVEGHRRWTAALEAGWTHVCVIVISSEWAERVYAEVNDQRNQKPLTTGNKLYAYMANNETVPERCRKQFGGVVAFLTRKVVMEVAGQGRAFDVCQRAVRIANYCGRTEDREFAQTALRWLIRLEQSKVARDSMNKKLVTPKELERAVLSGERLKPLPTDAEAVFPGRG